jgi:hypothetical protein
MADPEIKITKPKRGEVKPEEELTIEERIIRARDQFMSEKSADVERLITESLTENYEGLILKEVNLEPGRWHDDPKWKFAIYNSHPIADELRSRAKAHARTLVDAIDFTTVELTEAQVKAIKRAYSDQLKDDLANAARQIAREDTLRVARKVLGIQLEEPQEEEVN